MQPLTFHPERPASSSPAPSATARIISCAAHGDQHAWDQLVERYSGLLWAVARAHRLTSADAADVVQTSWLRLVEHLAEIRNPDGIGAWLATTARRECLRLLRNTARCELVDDIETFTAVDPGDLDGALRTAERNAGLRGAFERLPAPDQALLRLLTTDPTPPMRRSAPRWRCPSGQSDRPARALERLRRKLRDTGVLDDIAAERGP